MRLLRRALTETKTLLRSKRKKVDFNRIRNKTELWLHRKTVSSHPTRLYLDPINTCNLRCPFCPTGNKTSRLVKGRLTPEVFEKIFAHIRVDLLSEAHLYNWGEPLLNPHTLDYIRRFHDAGVPTWISTNFSVKDYDEEFIERLVRSGLYAMIVSIDGATQETYEKYRVGGDLARILRNLHLLRDVKRRLNSPTPIVHYRMLLNKFNEDQLDMAAAQAAEAEAVFVPDFHFQVPEEVREQWTAKQTKDAFGNKIATTHAPTQTPLIHTECRQLWDTLIVNCDGAVMPCCITDDQQSSVGNLAEQDIREIWNNDKIKTLRRFVLDKDAAPPDFHNSCEGCPNRYATHGKS